MGDAEIIDSLKDARNISATESYVKVDEFRNQTGMSKDECLKEVSDLLNNKIVSKYILNLSNDKDKEITDGYMKLQTISTYISNGSYRFSAVFT